MGDFVLLDDSVKLKEKEDSNTFQKVDLGSNVEENKTISTNDATNDSQFAKEVSEGLNYKDVNVSACIIGASGAGKSALINSICALVGPNRAKEGSLETTTIPKPYTPGGGGWTLWDIPGVGTSNVTTESYAKQYNLQQYDFIIVMLVSPRLKDAAELNRWAIELAQEKLKKPIFLVYSKFDTYLLEFYNERTQFDENAKKFTKLTQNEQTRYCEEAKSELSTRARFPAHTLYIGRPLKPKSQADKCHQFEYATLLENITNSLSGRKRDIVVENFIIYNHTFLEKKKALLKGQIIGMSIGSAIAGAIPVPGPGVAVDLVLLIAFFKKCKQVFGLQKKQIKSHFSADIAMLFIPRIVAIGASIGATLAIGTLDEVIKTVPVFGSIVGAAVGAITSGPLMFLALDNICEVMAGILNEMMIEEAKKQAEIHYKNETADETNK